MEEFEPDRAWLREPDLFQRFRVPEQGVPLAASKVDPDAMFLVVARERIRRAFLVTEMAYHHLAQGALGGQPYLVSFCTVCHSGVGLVLGSRERSTPSAPADSTTDLSC